MKDIRPAAPFRCTRTPLSFTVTRIARVFLIAAICFWPAGCGYFAHNDTLEIAFAGDIIMHIPVKLCAAGNNHVATPRGGSINNGGFDHLFARISQRLSASDLTVGNMEFPVSPPFASRPFYFNCYPDVVPAMKKAGFGLVSIANNHIIDQGAAGFRDTLGYLEKYGMSSIGAGADEGSVRAGYVFEKHGIRVGFIAYTGVINSAFPAARDGIFLNNLYKKKNVLDDIAAIRQRCDYLVMVAHFGDEYTVRPNPADTALLREYCDSGVDLVIGHHPHVLQPAETYTARDGRACHIFYSLGNFISNQSGAVVDTALSYGNGILSTRDSALVTLRLAKKKKALKQRFSILPIMTVNEILTAPNGAWRRNIQTAAVADEIARVKQKLTNAATGEHATLEARLHELESKYLTIPDLLLKNQPRESDDIQVE